MNLDEVYTFELNGTLLSVTGPLEISGTLKCSLCGKPPEDDTKYYLVCDNTEGLSIPRGFICNRCAKSSEEAAFVTTPGVSCRWCPLNDECPGFDGCPYLDDHPSLEDFAKCKKEWPDTSTYEVDEE